MELTVAPSCIIASKQLQALVVASKAWQGEQALMQQLLQHLAAPAAGSSLSAAGASCWLVNETGAPLSYVVADAIMEPAAATAALGTCAGSGSSSSSPLKPVPAQGARACASARGQAMHLTPVPLRVLDVSAAGYFGRFVEQGGVSDASFRLQPMQPGQATSCVPVAEASTAAASATAAAAGSGAGGGSNGVKQSQLLYVQGAGRVNMAGPVALSQMGCSVHPLRGLAAGEGVLSPGSTTGHARWVGRHTSKLSVNLLWPCKAEHPASVVLCSERSTHVYCMRSIQNGLSFFYALYMYPAGGLSKHPPWWLRCHATAMAGGWCQSTATYSWSTAVALRCSWATCPLWVCQRSPCRWQCLRLGTLYGCPYRCAQLQCVANFMHVHFTPARTLRCQRSSLLDCGCWPLPAP